MLFVLEEEIGGKLGFMQVDVAFVVCESGSHMWVFYIADPVEVQRWIESNK